MLRGGLTRSIALGNLAPRGYLFRLRSLDDGPAAAVAGWLDDGRLVYAAAAGLVATRPGQSASVLIITSDQEAAAGRAPPPSPDERELLLGASAPTGASAASLPSADAPDAELAELADLPLTLAGAAVLHRRAEAVLRRLELAPRRDHPLPAATAALRAVRCAGDRAAPCLAQLVEPDAVRYLAFDPTTGALGAELHRTAPGGSDHPALSPDGKTLALAGGRELRFVALPDGAITRHRLRPGLEPRSLSWSSDGRGVFLSTASPAPPRFSVWRVSREGSFDRVIDSEAREYGRAADSRDGALLALEARDAAAELWLVEGLAE